MELTDDDVLEILKLFEQSKFDFLQLEQGERKITVSKGGYTSAGMGGPGAAISQASSRSARQPASSPEGSGSDCRVALQQHHHRRFCKYASAAEQAESDPVPRGWTGGRFVPFLLHRSISRRD